MGVDGRVKLSVLTGVVGKVGSESIPEHALVLDALEAEDGLGLHVSKAGQLIRLVVSRARPGQPTSNRFLKQEAARVELAYRLNGQLVTSNVRS